MDEKKAQRIEKLADGILNLVIGIDVLSMLKVIPKLSEGAELWLVLIGGLAIGLGWLLGTKRVWKKVLGVLMLLLVVSVAVLRRALLFLHREGIDLRDGKEKKREAAIAASLSLFCLILNSLIRRARAPRWLSARGR